MKLTKKEIIRLQGVPVLKRGTLTPSFVAGQLHRSLGNYDRVLTESQPTKRSEVWNWIENKVSIFPYFSHFKGSYEGTNYDSDCPPSKIFQNNVSCKPFATFIRETLLARLHTGAIPLAGKVRQATPSFLVLPLTVEPSKPRLCHDARFLKEDNDLGLGG